MNTFVFYPDFTSIQVAPGHQISYVVCFHYSGLGTLCRGKEKTVAVAQLVECLPIMHKALVLSPEPDNLSVHICNIITWEAKAELLTYQKYPQQ